MIGVWIQKKPCSWKKRWIGLRQRVAHARDGAEGVGARAEVRHLAQVFERVLLGRDGIGLRIIHPADDLHLAGLDFDGLPLALRLRPACP